MTRSYLFIVSFFLGSSTFSCKGCHNEADQHVLNKLQDRVSSLEGALANNQENHLSKLQEIERGLTAVLDKITPTTAIPPKDLTEINNKITTLRKEFESLKQKSTPSLSPSQSVLQQSIIDLEQKFATVDTHVRKATKQTEPALDEANRSGQNVVQRLSKDLEDKLKQEIQKAILIGEQLKQAAEDAQKIVEFKTREAIDAAIQKVKEDSMKEALGKAEEKVLQANPILASQVKQLQELFTQLQEIHAKTTEEAAKAFNLYKSSTTGELHNLKDAIWGFNGKYGKGILQDIPELNAKTGQIDKEIARIDNAIKLIYALFEGLIQAINTQVIEPYNRQVVFEKNELKRINLEAK